MAERKIDRKQFPELDLILWDRKGRFVEAKAAFELYEKRWRHVDQKRLTLKERHLIDELKQEHGHGVMLTP